MKRFLYSALSVFVSTMCVCSGVNASVILDKVTLDVQNQSGVEQIVLEKYIPIKPSTDTEKFGKDVDYSKVKAVINLKDGRSADKVEILDTLVAKLEGTDELVTYKWQGSKDNVNWSTIAGATGFEYWITYENKYNFVRCVIKAGRLSFRSDAVKLPSRTMAEPAWEIGDESHKLPENRASSNPDYIFHLDGKGFVMLDDHVNSEATFYITTTEAYGDAVNAYYAQKNGVPSNKAVSAHGIFTVASDGSSIGQMLTTFGNNYNFYGDDRNITCALPNGIIDYATQKIAYPFSSSYWLRTRHFYVSPQNAGIWLLAWDDFVKYSDRLGYKDNLFDVGGTYYFLRDGSPIDGWYANCVVTDQGQSTTVTYGTGVVRPAFFLKEDFFKNVKLDSLKETGDGVLEAMQSRYYIEDLSHLYSIDELMSAGFKSKDGSETNLMVSDKVASLNSATDVTVNVSVKNDADVEKETIILFSAFDKNGKIVDAEIVSLTANAGNTTDAEQSMKDIAQSKEVCNISAMLLTASNE